MKSLLFLLVLPVFAQADPNWRTRSQSDAPLTGSQRVELFLRNDFASPGAFFRTVGPSLGAQLADRPKEWDKDAEGVGRRLAVNAVTRTSRDLIQSLGTAALGHDPRYQRCDCKGPWRRTGHALVGIFVQADSKGTLRFDPSNIVSAYGAGYLGASLYPDNYSIRQKGFQLGHQQVGQIAAENLILEFSPDLKRFFRTKILRKP